MKIKKLGHCCLVVEVNGKRIMTDPGSFTVGEQIKEKNIDLILITHEHQDHLHIDSLKEIIRNNPNVKIITNNSVGKLLRETRIRFEILENGKELKFKEIHIEAHGNDHAFIRTGVNPPQNTGYFIDKKLFYPGDALTNPNKTISILALPVAGPWLKIDEVLQYAKQVHPKTAFPVHDGMLNEFGLEYVERVPTEVLRSAGINFKTLDIGKQEEF
jgi:L-ascorbate metabolism protein UlaG (beta-lactamase superfamily)